MTRLLRASAVLLASVVLTSCAARSVSINELKADPGRYQNKSVSVTGTVTTAFGASIVPVGMYTIQDGTGEINVLARERGTPTKGAKLQVKGKVNQVASFGGRSVGLHIQEEDRKSRN
jgi:hypothetical protein